MKTNFSPIKKHIALLLTCIMLSATVKSQVIQKKIIVIDPDTKGTSFDPIAIGNLMRVEAQLLDTFEVIDKYDVKTQAQNQNIHIDNCFGKSCLLQLGLVCQTNYILSGSIEEYEKNITITLKLLDVKNNNMEQTQVIEFLHIPQEIQNMIKISVQKLFKKPFDKAVLRKLTKPDDFGNMINNPASDRLSLAGPRAGMISFTGQLYNLMTRSTSTGGYNGAPVMSMFGYQFESQYLSTGKIQGLFEFIPMISGIDQSHFFPSMTLLHGIRSNISGWEFAFGPTFNLVSIASGYYDSNNTWHLSTDWHGTTQNSSAPNPYSLVQRPDSRGFLTPETSLVIAIGKSFKSGNLNIPVNLFLVPSKEGCRIGLSVGFNVKR